MANIMSLANVRNKASRSGFDLSRRSCFTSKVGELLPVWWQFILPGDSAQIQLQSFVRTMPVNTASFGRIREYYDFFFVPLSQLWNKAPQVLTQMNDNVQHANGLAGLTSTNGELPCMSISNINSVLSALNTKDNLFGYSRQKLALKLLSYLGYGMPNTDGTFLKVPSSAATVNLFPLLAYQKIYSDFFRYTQWESPNPSTFNVDWMVGDGDTTLSASQFTSYLDENTMFDLRYCNLQKDMFHGIMPRAQFGSESVVALGGSDPDAYQQYFFAKTATGGAVSSGAAYMYQTAQGNILRDSSNTNLPFIQIQGSANQLSVLALRQAEALQRWKEVAMAAEEDYKQQVEAHWNVSVSELLSGQCRYLGGIDGNISVNEVVNTNLVAGETTQPADIAGKGIGSSTGSISFNSQGEYGIIMCIYHALPLLDYVTSGIDSKLLLTDATTFPIPELDSVGMELLPVQALTSANIAGRLGYVPRYLSFKTDYDRCFGEFANTLESWILPFADDQVLLNSNTTADPDDNPNVPSEDTRVRYDFFKCNPAIVDPMFSHSADETTTTDCLWNQIFVKCYMTRNLDYNGLPY